jgi:hypothetical protein
MGTHFNSLMGKRVWGTSLPSQPEEGQEFIDSTNNIHYIYANSQWFKANLTTSTSTSTTSTSSSTSTTSTSSSSSTTTSTSTSSSTTTTV